ncbi:MAG: alanine--glyoxylate aminotransferase family protein, partial [Acidimicrobiia bacterium]
PVVSWYLDVSLLAGYWTGNRAGRAYHHTAPISMMFALAEALRLIMREGLEERWLRHEEAGRFLQAELAAMGFDMLAPRRYRLPQLTAAFVPAGVDGTDVRQRLLEDFSIEVGGGMGDMAQRLWRIGLMGRGASREAAVRLIQAIEALITD